MFAAIAKMARPLEINGEKFTHFSVLPPNIEVVKAALADDFSKVAVIEGAVKAGRVMLMRGETDAGVKVDLDALKLFDVRDAELLHDAIISLLEVDRPADVSGGDGYDRPIVYALRYPFKIGDREITHIEFFARTYGDMRAVWLAEDTIGEFFRRTARLVHDGTEELPISNEVLSKIDGADIVGIALYVLPNFKKGGGELKIMRRR